MTDLRAQIEQLRRFSVNRLDDMLQDDPEGNLVLIDDVLALLADHAAPVVGETPREIEDTTRPSGADEPEQGRGSHPLTPIEKETR
jgi:hypothetical protein